MNTTPGHVFELLALHPYPGAKDVALDGSVLTFTVNGVKVCLDDDGWYVGDVMICAHLPCRDALDKPALHAEIDRILRLHADTPPRESRVYLNDPAERLQDRLTDEMDRRRDLKGSLKRIGEAVGVDSGPAEYDAEKIALIERRVEATRERCDALQQILPLLGLGVNSPADKARERIEGLGAEIDRLKGEVVDLTLRLGTTQNRVGDLESELAGVSAAADGLRRDWDFEHQRRANAEDRVRRLTEAACAVSTATAEQAIAAIKQTQADRSAVTQDCLRLEGERDAERRRATAAEAKVKRLLRQRRAAHDVLDEAGIGLEEEGSPRWTLARRCRAAVEPVWDHLDAVHALDEIAKLCGLTAPSLSTGATDSEVIAAVKTLAADAGFYRLDRPAFVEAGQARERIAAHLRLPGATWAQLADAIVAPKPSRLRRALARLVR